MLHVVCLKWGNKYPADYVNRLYGMVARNLKQPFTFHCMTENPTEIRDEVNILALPELGLQGWWYKLYLFKQDFFGLEGQVLFLDLDVVITGNLDALIDYSKDKLCISEDERAGDYNSSVMCFKLGTMNYVWESFWHQREKIITSLHGDQDWIQQICVDAVIYPKPLIVSFKYDCQSRARFGGGKLGKWLRSNGWFKPVKQSQVPTNTLIVLFHGKPDPEDVMDSSYDKYRYSPWIKEHWR